VTKKNTPLNESTKTPFKELKEKENGKTKIIPLKKKSILYLLITGLYIIFVSAYLLNEKNQLLRQLETYQLAEKSDKILTGTSHALRIINTNLLKGFLNNEPIDLIKLMHGEFIDLQKNYKQLQPLYPDNARQFKDLIKLLAQAITNPSSQSSLKLKQVLVDNQAQIDKLLIKNRQYTRLLLEKYHDASHVVAVNTAVLAILGLIIFGTILSLFFNQMTHDISSLQKRLKKIMHGYRKQDLEIHRNDELQLLANGINEMAQTLLQKEVQLELERKKQYSQQNQGAIEHLAAGLVHEIGNPVAAISGLIDNLQSVDLNHNEHKETLQQINFYTQRMNTIIEDLSKLATPLEKDLQLIDINNIIRSHIDLWYLDERSYGIEISLHLEPQIPAINGIAEQLNQVLSNLIINAHESLIKTSRKKKIISISSLSDKHGDVMIEIKDNGCGMIQEVIDIALDTLFTTKKMNMGLGLPLCKSIISAHQGNISLTSTPGNGTSVQIKLPAVK
jgi:two-component system, NtrC family, sensor kinase